MPKLNPTDTGYTAAKSASGTGIQWGNKTMYMGTHLGIAKFTSAISSSYSSFNSCWITNATVKIKNYGALPSSSITIAVTNTAPPSPSANPPATPACYRSGTFTCQTADKAQSTIDITSLFKKGGTAAYLAPNNTTWYIIFQMNSSKSARLTGLGGDSQAAELNFTISARPSVSAGSSITKAQMDTLKSYLGKGTAVTQNAVATQAVANTYAAATQYNSITASWYNNA